MNDQITNGNYFTRENNHVDLNSKFKKIHFVFILSYFALLYILSKALEERNSDEKKVPFNKYYRNLLEDKSNEDVFNSSDVFSDLIEQSILSTTFIADMSGREFKGNWTLRKCEANATEDIHSYFSDFKYTEGEFLLKIQTGKLSLREISGIVNTVSFDFEIKDGFYKDKWINFRVEFLHYTNLNLHRNDLNFSFNFSPEAFWTKLRMKPDKKIESVLMNMNMYQLEESTFAFLNEFEVLLQTATLNVLKAKLGFEGLGINLDLKGQEAYENSIKKKVSNFTLILTFIGILHVYNSLLTIREMVSGDVNPKSFSTLFVCSNMTWNAVLSVGCFYIAMNYPQYFTDFALPSIIYFIDFSIFQIRILFIVWRFHNLDMNLSQIDIRDLRRKMLRFYCLLYSCLFLSLLTIYYILLYKWILLVFVIVTFIPQIYHNTQVNISRNTIPCRTIAIVVINKLFFPLYYRLCPYNIFEVEPDCKFIAISLAVIVIEIFVLYLQAKFGALFLVPRFFRKGYFNYYKTLEEVKKLQPDFDTCLCSICLNPFIDIEENVTIELNKNINIKQVLTSTASCDMVNTIQVGTTDVLINNESGDDRSSKSLFIPNQSNKVSCKNKLKKLFKTRDGGLSKIKLMITPCNHIFHPLCLRSWAERKNECPVCRKVIPCIED